MWAKKGEEHENKKLILQMLIHPSMISWCTADVRVKDPCERQKIGEKMSEIVATKVIAAIAKAKKIAPETITLDSKFEELNIDSLDGLNLFFELEEEFDLSIPDERVRTMKTIGQVVEEIDRLLAERETQGSEPQVQV
jgi:acyl carrier protein